MTNGKVIAIELKFFLSLQVTAERNVFTMNRDIHLMTFGTWFLPQPGVFIRMTWNGERT